MSQKLLSGDQFAISSHINTEQRMLFNDGFSDGDSHIVRHARANHPVSIVIHNEVILFIVSMEMRDIKDLFLVPSQLWMNIFIPSLSICSFSLLAAPLCSASLSGVNLSVVALCLLMLPFFFSEIHRLLGFPEQIPLLQSKYFFFCISFRD